MIDALLTVLGELDVPAILALLSLVVCFAVVRIVDARCRQVDEGR